MMRFCRVSLPDYDQEDMVPVDAVLPRLRRDMIDEAVREVAPGYDLAREIKSASLALQPGAARTRADAPRQSSMISPKPYSRS